jgi:hypothetical protein
MSSTLLCTRLTAIGGSCSAKAASRYNDASDQKGHCQGQPVKPVNCGVLHDHRVRMIGCASIEAASVDTELAFLS